MNDFKRKFSSTLKEKQVEIKFVDQVNGPSDSRSNTSILPIEKLMLSMCGIVGYISDHHIPLENLIKDLAHRGPDSQGFFEATLNGLQVGLGHSRLSIIDLSERGSQPMKLDGDDLIIVFNGEVYNYKELTQKHLKSESFFSSSDTEVVLRLYQKLGLDFVHELNGDFAMAIFDRRKSKLHLIRDRLGVKPLYFFKDANRFIFASEIKPLLTAGVSARTSHRAIADYFVLKYSSGTSTLFQGIQRVEPGTSVSVDLDTFKMVKTQYWSPEGKYWEGSFDEAKKELVRIMDDAVRLRLIADVSIGNFLSGGIDSTIIAYHLKNQSDIQHYCASKSRHDLEKEGSTSDFYFASKLSKDWGLKLKELPIGSDEANLEMIRKTLQYSDDLIADGSQIPSYLITKAASSESKVILSGMGADEVFMGYAGHQITLLASLMDRLPKTIEASIGDFLAGLKQGRGRFLAYRRFLHKFGKYLSRKERALAYNIVGDLDNSINILINPSEVVDQLIEEYSLNAAGFRELANFERKNFLVKNLHYMDRMSMANSVEGRVPFLDHRLVEFGYSLPRSYKLANFNRTKHILKEAYRERIPSYIIDRRKAGFGMPLRSVFSNKQVTEDLLDRSYLGDLGFFKIDVVNDLCERHYDGSEDNSGLIYAIISFQEWHKMYLD